MVQQGPIHHQISGSPAHSNVVRVSPGHTVIYQGAPSGYYRPPYWSTPFPFLTRTVMKMKKKSVQLGSSVHASGLVDSLGLHVQVKHSACLLLRMLSLLWVLKVHCSRRFGLSELGFWAWGLRGFLWFFGDQKRRIRTKHLCRVHVVQKFPYKGTSPLLILLLKRIVSSNAFFLVLHHKLSQRFSHGFLHPVPHAVILLFLILSQLQQTLVHYITFAFAYATLLFDGFFFFL